ncbi:putative amidohydrolase [Lewinella aquimaris]|uniref:Putative amidohydrolase n=1 Tax=Neolewinella aquimaris TaxID=1835722 RepID=A0A840E2W3_9BACT|nr:nitrilase-related carbon-nitrogen hydrolase [Neolewinella aquimaris]MBB4079440.1 putative amidohydrolase [Neolewinella aquimaris]
MNIATYQFNAELGAVDRNLQRIEDILTALPPGKYDAIAFPEMCDTGYAMDVITERAVFWGPDHLAGIKHLAAEKNTTVVLGLSERVGDKLYNTTAVIDATGTLVHTYRKTHLVSIEPINEHRYITPGDKLGIFSLGGVVAGIMTCYELRFPEVARALTLRGVRLLFVPAAWPLVRVDHLTTLLRARAIENQIFIVSSSRVGTDAGTQFSGHSMIIDPNGEVLARGSESEEALLHAKIDLAEIERSRGRIGALGERRPELYF